MYDIPKWIKEFDVYKTFKNLIILEENIYDYFIYKDEDNLNLFSLNECLFYNLKKSGYSSIYFYNPIQGFSNDYIDDKVFKIKLEDLKQLSGIELLSPDDVIEAMECIRKVNCNNKTPVAFILNLASRYAINPQNMTSYEANTFLKLFYASQKITQVVLPSGEIINNLIILTVDKLNDVPSWLYFNNLHVKTITVEKPTINDRRKFFDFYIDYFYNNSLNLESKIDRNKIIEKCVDLTDGFTLTDLDGLRILCQKNTIPLSKFNEAVYIFKYGIRQNPWNQIGIEKIENAEEIIKKDVIGQDIAVTQTVDIIKRAIIGLSGVQHSAGGNRPKGVLFFAGPTGTGKTELAKSLGRLLFGSDDSIIRFDMSEYKHEHSDQRLIGAPPGYIGYDAGGQLTNAVKKNPFSILLFDEIDKAHSSILDKFLQILDDGRITDSKGETVYFSDTLIIFTSNIGMESKDETKGKYISNIIPGMTYEMIEEKVINEIKYFFNYEKGRPEILNRIGNNFIIFDFINEDVAKKILYKQIEKIIAYIRNIDGIDIIVKEDVYNALYKLVIANLDMGGRGVGNIVEKYFINPLSKILFENHINNIKNYNINNINIINNLAKFNYDAY